MDNIVIEKIKIKDLWSSFKEIIAGSSSNVNKEKIDKRLEVVYRVQSRLGATDSIASLEKDVQSHNIKQKATRSKRPSKVEAQQNNVQIINNKQEDILGQENNLEL